MYWEFTVFCNFPNNSIKVIISRDNNKLAGDFIIVSGSCIIHSVCDNLSIDLLLTPLEKLQKGV